MYLGTQGTFEEDTQLEVLAQLGVNHIDHTPSVSWMEWTTSMILELRERFDKFGISLEMMHLPLRGRPAIQESNKNGTKLDRVGQPNSAGVIFMGSSDEKQTIS